MAGLLFLAESVEYSMETSVASFFLPQCDTTRIHPSFSLPSSFLASSSVVASNEALRDVVAARSGACADAAVLGLANQHASRHAARSAPLDLDLDVAPSKPSSHADASIRADEAVSGAVHGQVPALLHGLPAAAEHVGRHLPRPVQPAVPHDERQLQEGAQLVPQRRAAGVLQAAVRAARNGASEHADALQLRYERHASEMRREFAVVTIRHTQDRTAFRRSTWRCTARPHRKPPSSPRIRSPASGSLKETTRFDICRSNPRNDTDLLACGAAGWRVLPSAGIHVRSFTSFSLMPQADTEFGVGRWYNDTVTINGVLGIVR